MNDGNKKFKNKVKIKIKIKIKIEVKIILMVQDKRAYQSKIIYICIIYNIAIIKGNRKAESTLRFAGTTQTKLNKNAMIAELNRLSRKQESKIAELADVIEKLKQPNANNTVTMTNMTTNNNGAKSLNCNLRKFNQLTSINEQTGGSDNHVDNSIDSCDSDAIFRRMKWNSGERFSACHM